MGEVVVTKRDEMQVFWPTLGILWFLGFAVGETYALITNHLTLSRFTWQVSVAWPLFIALSGLVVGILSEHFWRFVSVQWDTRIDRIPDAVRWPALGLAWSVVIVLTGGGLSVFLCLQALGMLACRLLWVWNPRDANAHNG